ncbi:tripartite tricarboxylate transporter TctB family protein [uncultured Enterovirga sp.]|uniref:tripartite tricarboxylate transporter TctB family protein n=1 Tax=uncultured Enterovirga sp. TaxID=2026352 RepID=UPI0035CC060F
MIRMRSPHDVLLGLFMICAAAIGAYLCRDLRVGTSARMGPGYMPLAMSILLALLGAVSLVRGLAIKGDALDAWRLRPLALITLSISFFAFAIERLGLVLAIIGLVFIGSLAAPETKRLESFVLSVGLATFCVLVFAKALGLPFQLWPEVFN